MIILGSRMANILTLCILGTLMLTGCASTKVYVLGLDAKQTVRDLKEEDAEKIVLGALVSVGTHIAGHHIAAKLVGGEIDQKGLFKEVTTNSEELSNSDHRWIARGGFVVQTLVNTALTSFEATRESNFTRGFTLGTILQIGTYPLNLPGEPGGDDADDIKYLDNYGGNGTAEWVFYTGISGYNFYRINKKGE